MWNDVDIHGGELESSGPARATLHLAALLGAAAALPLLTACGGPDQARAEGGSVATAAFEQLFREDERIVLEESDPALIAEITGFTVGLDGRIAVADRLSNRVYVYDSDGTLLASLGGLGEGPGEFDIPVDAAFGPDGELYVAETGNGRISRFGPGFAYDTAFRTEDAYHPSRVDVLEDRLLVYVARETPGGEALRIYTSRGQLLDAFHPKRAEYRTVPYWSASAFDRLAVSESHVVAGGNLLYPFARYDRAGTFVDSVGTPPSNWVQAPRPERGRFAGPDRWERYTKWQRTFTTVSALAIYRDSLLLVAHKELDPEILAYEEASYTLDAYRLSGEKLVERVPLPGPLLAGGERAYLLLSRAPEPWTVGAYDVDLSFLER